MKENALAKTKFFKRIALILTIASILLMVYSFLYDIPYAKRTAICEQHYIQIAETQKACVLINCGQELQHISDFETPLNIR